MKHTDILDWKISNLAENKEDSMPTDMKDYLDNHPELKNELDFIDEFWGSDMKQKLQPSAQMDANFYQMLSRAQATQTEKITPEHDESIFSSIKRWFSPQPVAQFAALGLVFTLGFNLNQTAMVDNDSNGIASLKQEVSSLNTMLAISLLDKGSASERLSGVAYSRTSNLDNPVLKDKLISLIQSDKSTSVRLAVLNRLGELSDIEEYSEQLLLLTVNENNVLVQLALCQLLMNRGSLDTQQKLNELLKTKELPHEVRDVLQANSARSFT